MSAILRHRTILGDADQAYDYLERTYGRVKGRSVATSGSPAMEFRSISTGVLRVDVVTNRMPTEHAMELHGDHAFALCLSGSWAYDGGAAGAGHAIAGDPVTLPASRQLRSWWEPFTSLTIRIPLSQMARVAEEYTGISPAGFHFLAMTPTTPAMAKYWASAMRHCAAEISDRQTSLASPLVHAAAVDALCAGALATFPSTATTQAGDRSGRAGRDRVRAAQDYIQAHAARPITLSDIAGAAGCSPRALRAAFRRELDDTPMGYVRAARLAGARRDLGALDPNGGPDRGTAAEVARRWGFATPDRLRNSLLRRYGQDDAVLARLPAWRAQR